jgi:RimJ/RimL family protein N-acetyltransferase
MAPPPTLEDHRVRLTPLRVEDASEMCAVLADPELYRFTGGEAPSLGQLRAKYARQVAGASGDGGEMWFNWICRDKVSGLAVGYVQATVRGAGLDPEAEIAWVIGRPWQGRGFASASAALMVEWLADQGVRRFLARIHPSNASSERVAARLGLQINGEVVDGELEWAETLEARRPGQ